ncbi:MAG: prepilin-type N-terminal cleavage/methylation domain-containing protein [Ketobacter sp.]|nr:prepilin-type N-terminal cleavage/methylation domain-containing protein [Ketobacter sp.]
MKVIPRVVEHSGFTLVELVIAISLMGVVSVLVTTMVGNQMLGYVDTARRAELVAKADMALQVMARDLRNAVPHSIRVSGGNALEWVPVQDWGRYRKRPDSSLADPVAAQVATLDFSTLDTEFDVLHSGTMPALPANARVVVGNTSAMGSAGINLYAGSGSGTLVPLGSHVITPSGVIPAISGNQITLAPGFQFALGSAAGRFYLVNNAASYLCNGTSITRYGGYPIQSSQPTSAPVGSSAALLIDGVTLCQFGYTTLDATYGMLTISLQVTDSGESVTLVRSITIENRS